MKSSLLTAMNRNWLLLTTDLSEKIQKDVIIGLNDIKNDFESKGLSFNGKFRDHFYKSISNRLTEAYEIFEIEKAMKSTKSDYESYTSPDRLKRKREFLEGKSREKIAYARWKSDDDDHPSKWSFACAHCFSEDGSNVWYDSKNKVHKHWQDTHDAASLPFRFHVDCSVACLRCGLVGCFEKIRNHTFTIHLTHSTIIKNIRNSCENVPEYSRKIHSNEIHSLDALNPIPFSYRDLIDLGAIGEHEFRCPYCERSYKTKNEIKNHHRSEHPAKRKKYEKVKLICCLCEQNIRNTKFLAHVKECGIFKCNKCQNFQAKTADSFLDHMKEMHSYDLNDRFHSSLRRSLFNKYSAMKCIFANGLVVTQRNLAYSRYNIESDFIKLVADAVNELRTNVKRSDSNYFIRDAQFHT